VFWQTAEIEVENRFAFREDDTAALLRAFRRVQELARDHADTVEFIRRKPEEWPCRTVRGTPAGSRAAAAAAVVISASSAGSSPGSGSASGTPRTPAVACCG
jgi:hypothetical protein